AAGRHRVAAGWVSGESPRGDPLGAVPMQSVKIASAPHRTSMASFVSAPPRYTRAGTARVKQFRGLPLLSSPRFDPLRFQLRHGLKLFFPPSPRAPPLVILLGASVAESVCLRIGRCNRMSLQLWIHPQVIRSAPENFNSELSPAK